MLLVFAFILTSNVNYSININSLQIPSGEDTKLFYEIENGLIFDDIYNVKFIYSIQDKNGNVKDQG